MPCLWKWNEIKITPRLTQERSTSSSRNEIDSNRNEMKFYLFFFYKMTTARKYREANIKYSAYFFFFINNECRIMNCVAVLCVILYSIFFFFELLSLEKARIDRLAFIYCVCALSILCCCLVVRVRCCSILLLYCVDFLVTKIWRRFISNKNHWHSNTYTYIDESLHSLWNKNKNE